MQGQRQVFVFVVIIILVCSFNFIRKAVKRNNDLAQQLEETKKRKLELAEAEKQRLHQEEAKLVRELEQKRNEIVLSRLKEHKNMCYDLDIFARRPHNNQKTQLTQENISKYMSTINSKSKENLERDMRRNTSEPIIYLFVLVLIYSLLKAASDFTQHYQQKSEEDNNCRRHSLNDYAHLKQNSPTLKGSIK